MTKETSKKANGLKSCILSKLEQQRGCFLSGEVLASELSVTRAAVWKAVKALREEGFEIISEKNQGYCLSPICNRLSREGIEAVLSKQGFQAEVLVYDSVDSTQDIGKRLASEHRTDYGLVTADTQVKGRGRYGKSFYSPSGTGIYMSLVIRVDKPIESFLSITTATAVALCRVIERHSHKKPEIKWVNDVWIDGRKAAGILTEAVSDLESGLLSYVVIGIGMNLSTADFPPELKDIAFSIDDMDIGRSPLIGEIGAEVFTVSSEPDSSELFSEYKSRSLILGRDIWWMQSGKRYTGRAVDINRQGNLIVDTEKGPVVLSSGEVSIRPL